MEHVRIIKKCALILCSLLILCSISITVSAAAKTGSACTKLSAKSWDGEKPIICSKSANGKLIWTAVKSQTATKASCTIPYLLGTTFEVAYRNILSAGFTSRILSSNTLNGATSQNQNTISSQYPSPSSIVECDVEISLVIFQYKQTPNPNPVSSATSASGVANGNNQFPGETIGQANARKMATQYLNSSAYSRSGLIKQLKFEGFNESDATYGVDAQNADWRTQAVKSAASYLRSSAFSRSGLVKQLEFSGFSTADANYAVDAQNADWFDQAVKSAASYLKSSAFSRSGLIKQLELGEGFTTAEATFGADSNGFASTPPKKPDASTSNQNSGTTSSVPDTPEINRVFSGSGWIAYEIRNPSKTNTMVHPSYTVTASNATGVVLLEARNDKFPMLNASSTQWMYMPFSTAGLGASGKVTLTKYSRTTNRPTNPAEWPVISNISLSGAEISFNLSNKSPNLKLMADSIFYYFCLDAQGIPSYADQYLSLVTLLPNGSTPIRLPTNLKNGQCNSIAVSIGAVYS